MSGRTGKRAKPPTPCVDCGADLRGQAFFRDGKKDRCTGCGEKHIKDKFSKREVS
jgi:hypothetical protein